jgi:hypothetical protein
MITLLPSNKVIVAPFAAETSCDVVKIVPATISGLDADFVVSAADVAVIVTVYGVGTADGAE